MTTDQDFPDTMVMPRRADPMPFEPVWYARRSSVAACRSNACRSGRDACHTPDACRIPADEDSDFGALDGLVRGRRYIAAAWAFVAATAAAAYLIWF